ncbi:MAG: amidase [Alphaproteobacteria bacterium]|nr:amidase [Alphaproteobacteria bacterium]
MSNIAFLSASNLTAMLRGGKISSVELLAHYLDRVARLNPALNAIVYMDAEAAMARAAAADQARAAGQSWGPLHGLPMTIKDSFEVAGMITTSGAPELREHRSQYNAVTVQRLLDAGAVIFGRTNVPLYTGDLQSYNSVYGTTNNPWDVSRTPGGSSGGAAAAVAAGLCGMELGSDIGGSIRTPSGFCGIYGHKPSWGLVPGRGHIPGPPGAMSESDMNVCGPMARAPEDLEMALKLLAGPDPLMGLARPKALPAASDKPLQGLRIAAWIDDPVCPVDRSVGDQSQTLLDSLARAGAIINDKARPDIDPRRAFATYVRLVIAVNAAGFPDHVIARLRKEAEQADARATDYAANFAIGATMSHRQWQSANEARNHMRARWNEFFNGYDVLLCPISPTPAFPHDQSQHQRARRVEVNGKPFPYMDQLFWAGLTGMAYLPSTAAPIGRTPSGLPVGVQIVGPYYDDLTTIRVARLIQEVTGGFTPPPGYG